MTAPRLGYVVRFVASLTTSVAFYEGVLRQRLTKRTEHWAQFDCGPIRFGLYERGAMADALGVDDAALGDAPGALELAFEVEDCDAAYTQALAAGARSFRPPADRAWGERTAYILDPDGALVELYTPGPAEGRSDAARSELRREADAAEAERSTEMGSPSTVSRSLPDPNA